MLWSCWSLDKLHICIIMVVFGGLKTKKVCRLDNEIKVGLRSGGKARKAINLWTLAKLMILRLWGSFHRTDSTSWQGGEFSKNISGSCQSWMVWYKWDQRLWKYFLIRAVFVEINWNKVLSFIWAIHSDLFSPKHHLIKFIGGRFFYSFDLCNIVRI